jgi:cobyrinic acid ac-diamide synthase|nr:MAG TPA: ParA [Caudoviricetes sp.]
MAVKIMFGLQKGGVGKTTSTSVIGALLAMSGYKTLVIDMDSQGNSTQMLTQKNIYEFENHTVLEAIKEQNPQKYIYHAAENLDLLPAEDSLITLTQYIYISGIKEISKVLANAMASIENQYDYILVDCPPNLGEIVANSLVYADFAVIPVPADPFSMDALDRFVEFIKQAKSEQHTKAEILGIFFTQRNMRVTLEQDTAANIRERYGDLVFKTEIRTRSKLKEFILDGINPKKVADYEALDDYLELTKEIVNRVQERQI